MRAKLRLPRTRFLVGVLVGAAVVSVPVAWATHTFTDVPTDNPHHNDITLMKTTNITAGCNPPTNNQYCPTQAVTRQQMASFLARALGLVVRPGETTLAPVAGSQADKLDGLDASAFAPAAHDHDARYYTKAQVDAAVAAARDDRWAYVTSSGLLHASSGDITVTKPGVGEYCVVVPKRSSRKAAQATLADPGGTKIVSVGTGHGSNCNFTPTHDAVPVFVRTTAGAAVDANFTIVVPEP